MCRDGRLLSICRRGAEGCQGGAMTYGQQGGGDGRWQPPEWRYGQQRHEQGNERRGYEPGQPQGRPLPTWSAQPGQQGFGPPSPRPPYQPPYQPPQPPNRPPRGKSWPARHKALTGLLAFIALIIIIVAANSGTSPASPGGGTTAGLTTTASATTAVTPSKHATRVAGSVQPTQPTRTQPVPATSQAPASPAKAPTTPTAVVVPPSSAPATSAAPASCHPLTDAGKCYEPGEFCRATDHGASGLAGDGEVITCEDNDGWRWEPS
jgi:hypothetical protein